MKTKLTWLTAAAVGLAWQLCPQALANQITVSSSPGVIIPDDNLNGVADTINLSTAITSISDVQVTLDITGGYNGDYYAYLRYGTGFAVLLNRVGVTAIKPYGSPDSGFSVTFSDTAATDIHSASAGGGVLTGTFQPDARNVSPFGVLDTSPRTAFLSTFDGMDPNGAWSLFIADVSPVGVGTLKDWGLKIDGIGPVGVPDGGATFGLLGMALAGLVTLRRKRAGAC